MQGTVLKRFAILWSALLLLQQFSAVLLMHVQPHNHSIKNDNSRRNHKDSLALSTTGYFESKKDTTPIDRIVGTIRQMVERLNQNDSISINVTSLPETCDLFEQEQHVRSWREHVALYPFFILFWSIAQYITGCYEAMRANVRELVDMIDADDVIDFLQEMAKFETEKSFRSMDRGNAAYDAETPEAMMSTESEDITAENVKNINLLSMVFDSFNQSQKRPIHMHFILNDVIAQYRNLETIFKPHIPAGSRTKRDMDKSPMGPLSRKGKMQDEKAITKTLTNVFSVLKHSNDTDNIIRTAYAMVQERLKTDHRHPPMVHARHRTRRELGLRDEAAKPFFIKNSAFPCKLFTAMNRNGDSVISMETYSETVLVNQLWVWENGSLQNLGNGLYTDLDHLSANVMTDTPSSGLNLLKRNTSIIIQQNGLEECNFEITPGRLGVYPQRNCQRPSQSWHFVFFETAREAFETVACMYVIQHRNTCLVLEQERESVMLGPLTERVKHDQLWYWDSRFLRNAKSHMYLIASGTRVFLSDTMTKEWTHEDKTLQTRTLGRSVTLKAFPDKSIATASMFNSSVPWDMIATHKATPNCKNGNYFALKNSESTCTVLCVAEIDGGPYIALPNSVGILTATTVAAGSLLLAGAYVQRQGRWILAKFLLVAAVVLGVATSVPVVCFSVLHKLVEVIQEKAFDSENPLSCLWYSEGGKLVNAKYNDTFAVEKGGQQYQLTFYDELIKTFDEENLCFLHSSNEGTDGLLCKREQPHSKWRSISYFDDQFHENVFCIYVLPHSQPRCGDVLRTIGNDLLYPREDIFEYLWYHQGDRMMNVKTGDILDDNLYNLTAIEFNNYVQLCTQSSSLFFLQSRAMECKVLGYDRVRDMVTFQEYDDGRLLDQLWYLEDGSLLNYGTGLDVAYSLLQPNYHDYAGRSLRHEKWAIEEEIISVHIGNQTFYILADPFNMTLKTSSSEDPTERNEWKATPFDRDRAYLQRVLCYYFIQTQDEPCEVLTADSLTQTVVMAPVSDKRAPTQLWLISKGEIVNLYTGLWLTRDSQDQQRVVLRSKGNESSVMTWKVEGNTIKPSGQNVKVLSVQIAGRLLIAEENSTRKTQKWNFLESGWSLDNLNSLSCHVEHNTDYMFIKHSSEPCKVLAASEDGLNVVFQEFQESTVYRQLWYFKYGHLINVANALSMQINSETGEVILTETQKYNMDQFVAMKDGALVHVANGEKDCVLIPKQVDRRLQLGCNKGVAVGKWSLISIGEDSNGIGNVLCMYVIQSQTSPCEVITGFSLDGVSGTLKVRPVTEDLVESQVFYWKTQRLVHSKSGLYVTVVNGAVMLSKESSFNETIFYRLPYKQIVVQSRDSRVIGFDPSNDGTVVVHEDNSLDNAEWRFIALNQNTSEPLQCSKEKKSEKYFLIRNNDRPCFVLTGADKGASPEFKRLDSLNMSNQLWRIQNNNIINADSGLAVMIGEELPEGSFEVMMWHSYAFSRRQGWSVTTRGSFSVQSIFNRACYLTGTDNGQNTVASANCYTRQPDRWEFVDIDHASIFDTACPFFIQSSVEPCELLTVVGSDMQVRLRPFNATSNLFDQLWYWDGDRITNARTAYSLSVFSDTIALSPNSRDSWSYENTRITLKTRPSNGITFSHDHGGVYITVLSRWRQKYQSWVFVNVSDVVDNQIPLHCIANEAVDAYIIRNEYERCAVLALQEGNKIKTIDSKKKIEQGMLWVLRNDHLINIAARKSLSVTPQLTPYLETTYSHEPRQHWEMTIDGRIKHWLYGPKFLEVSRGDVIVGDRRKSTKQKWTWFTVSAYHEDDKLMRCTRCYDKGEETASEVIGAIPFISWLYNLFRAIAYAAKNCPEVTQEALNNFGVDLALDIVTLLSGGTAAAFAYGIKTGIKFGVKAGVKAAFQATKAVFRGGILALKDGFKSLAKNGLRNVLKRKITSALSSVKSTVKMPFRLVKSGLKASVTSLRKHTQKITRLVKGADKSLDIFSTLKGRLKHLPRLVKNRVKFVGMKLAKKMKDRFNKLASKAEDAIASSKIKSIPNRRMNCRRFRRMDSFSAQASHCGPKIKTPHNGKDPKVTIEVLNDVSDNNRNKALIKAIKNPEDDATKPFENLKKLAKKNNIDTQKQYCCVGITKQGQKDFASCLSIEDTQQQTLRQDMNTYVTGKQHPDQRLFEDVGRKLDTLKCTKKSECKVYLFTKNSPCLKHEAGNDAVSCIKYISEMCKKWKSRHVQCQVGFEQIYNGVNYMRYIDNNEDLFKTYFTRKLKGRSTSSVRKELEEKGISSKAFTEIDKTTGYVITTSESRIKMNINNGLNDADRLGLLVNENVIEKVTLNQMASKFNGDVKWLWVK